MADPPAYKKADVSSQSRSAQPADAGGHGWRSWISSGRKNVLSKIQSLEEASGFSGVEVGIMLSVTVGLGAAGALWWWWRRRVKRDEEDVLVLTRRTVVRHTGRHMEMLTTPLEVFRFMELKEAVCKQEPYCNCDMVSMVDYIAALDIPGDFNWQRVVRTALVANNMKWLLPLTDMMQRPEGPVDPFKAIGGERKVYNMLRDSLSPLHLSALGELMNLGAQGKPDAAIKLATEPCVKTYCRGERKHVLSEKVWDNLPEHFILDVHLPRMLEALDPDAEPGKVEPTAGVKHFPDVSFSHVGMPYFCNDWQMLCGQAFAVVLNRLSSNMMPVAWKPEEWRDLAGTVQLTADSPRMSTPGEFIAALKNKLGADVEMQIVTRITSFGKGCSVKQDGKWLQVPIAVPLRTGVGMLDDVTAKSSGRDEISTLMVHGELALRVSLPGQFSFRISWYQGIEGFTGWHGGNDVHLPWASGSEAEVKHTSWSTTKEYAAAADMAAMVANASNRMADQNHLPSGGYGYLGVCMDSVATIQAGLGSSVTMFPCMISGQAKTRMAQTYMEISKVMQNVEERASAAHVAEVAGKAFRGLLSMPDDLRPDPTQIHLAIPRIKACLPVTSPFETVEKAREDLDVALQQYRNSALLQE